MIPAEPPMLSWRRLLLAALVLMPALLTLLALGTWQVQRLTWKTDLLRRIAAAEAAAPVPLPGEAVEPFAKVIATGRFDHAREALLGLEVRGGALGAHLVTVLLRPAALPPLLVDRGWVPLARGAPVDRPEGEVAVTGYVRPRDSRSWFAAEDDPAGRRFYTFDPDVIGAALGVPTAAPFALVALAPPGAGPISPHVMPAALPDPARHLPRPTNNHLGYAITWYGLAVALIGVFSAVVRHRLREAGLRTPHGSSSA